MMNGLLVDGRIGVTAIAEDDTEALRLYRATATALHDRAALRQGASSSA